VSISVSESAVRDRLARVRESIDSALERGGRSPGDVKLLVASKYYAPEQMEILRDLGVGLVGENRAEDLVAKQDSYGEDFDWHFIGHLQRRKAKDVVGRVGLIHSVDSVRLIEELAKRAPENGVDVLLQLNVSGEESKYGASEEEVEELLDSAAGSEGRVRVRGFTTIAPFVEDAEEVRYIFVKLRSIRDNLMRVWSPRFDLSELSMGMSGDYVVAVEEGATIVRIGRTLIEEDSS
jgi:pyridoxal phosphate enzyme (YggS family)